METFSLLNLTWNLSGWQWQPKCDVPCHGHMSLLFHQKFSTYEETCRNDILMTAGIILNGAPMTRLFIFCQWRVLKCLQLAWMKQRNEDLISSVGRELLVSRLQLTCWQVGWRSISKTVVPCRLRDSQDKWMKTWSYLPDGAAHLPSPSSSSSKNRLKLKDQGSDTWFHSESSLTVSSLFSLLSFHESSHILFQLSSRVCLFVHIWRFHHSLTPFTQETGLLVPAVIS